MKVLRLDLVAFGPFTDAVLDFSGAGASFHVVYGPNEAGKSTALRALHGLFFGIPEASSDAHLHPANALRVGATLSAGDGSRLELVRRRGRKKTLRGPDDEPVDEGALARLLGGVGEEAFLRLFGLDHERLRAGAAALVEGEGQVGRSLFDAGLGGRGIARLLEALEKERDAIWRPRGSNPTLNSAMAKLKKSQARLKSEGLSVEAWVEAESKREALEAEAAELAEEHRRLRLEQRRLERVCRLLPLVAEHADLLEKRRGLGDGPRIAPASIASRRELSAGHEARARYVTRISAQRDAIARQLTKIGVDARLLALADDVVDGLAERLSAYRRSAAERPARASELATLEERLATRLRALGRSSLEDAERARPEPATMARLRALGARRSGLEQASRAAQEALARVDARIESTTARLAKLGPARDVVDLERALEDAKRDGDPKARQDEASRAIDSRRRELDAAIRALLPWQGSPDQLVALERPLDETVEQLVGLDEELRRDRARLEEERVELGRARADLANDLDLLLVDGEPPSEDELQDARTRRDALFAELRATGDAAGQAGALLGEAITAADAVADRLRAEATRVAKKRALEVRKRGIERRAAEVDARHAELEAREEELDARLRASCAPFGLDLRAPAELRGYLRRVDEARGCASRAAEAEESARGIERSAAWHSARLGQLLGDTSAADLRERIEGAERALRDARSNEAERKALVEALDRVGEERAELVVTAAAAAAELAHFLTEWRESVAALGLNPEATTEEAFALLDLFTGLEADALRASELRRGLEASALEAADLTRASAELAERHAPSLVDADIEERIAELVGRHRDARASKAKADGLEAELARLDAELAASVAELEADERDLAAFRDAAGAVDLATLAAREDLSEEARVIDERLSALESALAREGEGAPIESLLREVEGASVDRTREDLASIEARIEALAADEKRAGKALGGALAGLEQAKNRSADDAAAEVESHLAEVRAESGRYVRASLAAAILRREIERYRSSHEGPILAGARALLPRLTLGRYTDLRVLGAGEAGSLRCVRSDGAELAVESLSDGTRDQLFLALRLAAVVVHAAEEPPLPLVLDDVFIHFDDERARAGLEVLGELSTTTQVLFFTHHARLVELARAVVPAARLRVHTLDAAHHDSARKAREISGVEADASSRQ